MTIQYDSEWDSFIGDFDDLKRNIIKSSVEKISATKYRDSSKAVAQLYFRRIRPGLLLIALEREIISELDTAIKNLFRLSMKVNRRSTYVKNLGKAEQLLESIAILRELHYSDEAFAEASPDAPEMSQHERLIYDSMMDLVPSAARSYRQAILDLSIETRLSYRGAANELREALREVLDHLAPDDEIQGEPGFKLEQGQTKPTRKQKARHILRARGQGRTASKVPEDMIEAFEEKLAVVVSATYSRTNLSTHVQTERQEVLRLKRYVDTVLSELLAIPA